MVASILVLNKQFIATYAVSDFKSFIWTERYWACGDFRLETIFTLEIFNNIKVGDYIYLNGSDYIMIVEKVQIGYSPIDRNDQTLVFSGRSMESILDRRIIWEDWEFNDSVHNIVKSLVYDNLISPSDSKRRINIIHWKNSLDSDVYSKNIELGGYCDGLYEVIQAICQTYGIGMRALYRDGDSFVSLELYSGKDRSYSQSMLPPIIFSSNYENLGMSRYTFSTDEYKTFALVAGPEETYEYKDDDGNVIETIIDRTVVTVGNLTLSGLDRREVYVPGSKSKPDILVQNGMEKLAKLNTLELLDAELDARRQFVYGRDFFLGDVVQIVTDYGLDARSRVTEFIRSWDETGYTEVPTFEVIDESEQIKNINIIREGGYYGT